MLYGFNKTLRDYFFFKVIKVLLNFRNGFAILSPPPRIKLGL